MAGYVKKGASTWSPAVPSIYVKTGANTWAAATSAWIKINDLNDSTSWKQWFTGSVIDSFTRTTSGSLGSADLGGTWVNGVFSGTTGWYANGSTAFNADSQGSGTSISAWSSVEAGSNNSFAEVATSGGVGPMIWANYSGSTPTTWWAAIPYKIETATPYEYQGNCTCNATTTCNTCASASACGSTSTPFSYNATANYVYQGASSSSTDVGAAGARTVQGSYASCTYSCPSGQTLGGVGNTSCYTNTGTSCIPAGASCSYTGQSYSTTTITLKTCQASYSTGVVNSSQGSCTYNLTSGTVSDGGCETGTSGNYRGCKSTESTAVTGTCSCSTTGGSYVGPAPCTRTCPAGQTYPGTGTYCTSTVYDVCSSGTASGGRCYVSSSSCAGSYSGSPAGTACSYFTGYTCPSGGTQSGGVCSGTSVVANTCASCSQCGSVVTGGGTYPNCSAQGFTCQTLTGYTYAYTYGIKIVQGSGSSYTVISDTSTAAFAAVVRVATSGNTLTMNAWSDTAKSTQVANNVTATNSGTKGTKCGIVRAYSQYQQGNTADNFSAGVI